MPHDLIKVAKSFLIAASAAAPFTERPVRRPRNYFVICRFWNLGAHHAFGALYSRSLIKRHARVGEWAGQNKCGLGEEMPGHVET
jgi:hypothetical protein